MKKLIIIALATWWSCTAPSISKADLHYLNGYWEIHQVTFPDGNTREYAINTDIDFIHVESEKGFRKKMQPRADGTYSTSDQENLFTLKPAKHTFVLQYKNKFSTREETLIHLDTMAFSVMDEEGVLYAYKRFNPVILPE